MAFGSRISRRWGDVPGTVTLARHEICSGERWRMSVIGVIGVIGTPGIAGLTVTGVQGQSYGIGSPPFQIMRDRPIRLIRPIRPIVREGESMVCEHGERELTRTCTDKHGLSRTIAKGLP